jgi:hypothetical protein
MTSTNRLGVVAAAAFAMAVATAGTSAATPGSASAGQPRHVVALTSGHSHFRDEFNVVAGSPTWLVYEQLHTGQRGEYAGALTLKARSASGATKTVPLPARLVSLPLGDDVSLVDNMLVVMSGQQSSRPSIDWRNLSTGSHGHSQLPARGRFVGASPDGWVYVDGSAGPTMNQVFDQRAAGGVPTSLGDPASPSLRFTSGVSGPDGFVVRYQGDTSGVWFSAWGASTFTALAVPAAAISCSVEAFNAVACLGGSSVLRVPTNGDPAVSSPVHSGVASLALTATQTGWVAVTTGSEAGPTSAPSPSFALFTAPSTSGSPATKASYHVRYVISDNSAFEPLNNTLTSAFGKFAIGAGQPISTSLATTPSAGSTRTVLVRATHSTVHALAISLTKHRVVYASDSHVYNGGQVLARHVSDAGHVGKTTTVLSKAGAMVDLASSASTVASVTSVGSDKKTFHEIMHVRDGRHRWTVNDSAVQQVAGHYVLYTHKRRHITTALFNAATGRNVALPASLSAAITPSLLVYQATDGSVRARPIAGGKSRKLFGVPAGVQKSRRALTLFAQGGYVAATYGVDSDEGNSHRNVEVYRKLASGSAVHSFKVTRGVSYTSVDGQGLLSTTNGLTTIRLFKTGHTRTVLRTSFFSNDGITVPSQVSVLGNRVAWIDGSGQAHVGNWR